MASALSEESDNLLDLNREIGNREVVKRRRKSRPNTESTGSELSIDSLASVNSILSDESSIKTYRFVILNDNV